MEYQSGTVGRVIVIRLHTGDPIYESIESVAKKEQIENGAVWIIGGASSVGMTVGPKDHEAVPIEAIRVRFDTPHEMLGFGTIFRNQDNQPTLHLHASFGKGSEVFTGCPREQANCWLINEIIMLEIKGINAQRLSDSSGFELLSFLR